jgi:hypothetical protein
MPNPRLPLDQFKDEIYNWIFIDCLKNKDIASLLSTRLGKPCSLRTLENRLQEWNFSQRNQVKDSVELRLQIAILFQQSYSDKNIVRQLSRSTQIIISERQVAKIRKKLGFVRRMTVWERKQADEQLIELVRKELDSGVIEGYGRGLLDAWFRRKGVVTTRSIRTNLLYILIN